MNFKVTPKFAFLAVFIASLALFFFLLPNNPNLHVYVSTFCLAFFISYIVYHVLTNLSMVSERHSIPQVPASGKSNRSLLVIVALIVCLILANLFVSLRFVSSFSPKGFDTSLYVYSLESLYHSGTFRFDLFFHPVVSLLFLPSAFVFSGNPLLLGISLPFIAGSVLIAITFVSIYLLSKSIVQSALVSIFVSSSFFFIRLTYDLYSQTIFLALFLLSLVAFSKILSFSVDNPFSSKRFVSLLFLSLVLLFFVDPTSSLLVYLFYLIAFLVRFRMRVLKVFCSKRFLLLAGLGFLLLLTGLFLGFFDKFLHLYSTIFFSESTFFYLSQNWNWLINRESIFILLLSTISVGYFVLRGTRFVSREFIFLLSLWSTYVFMFIFVTGYSQSYRLVLFLPISIFAALGIYGILKERLASYKIPKLRIVRVKHVIGFTLLTLVVLTAIPQSVISEYNYYPNGAVSVFSDMTSVGGLGSSDVLYVVPRLPNVSPYWYKVYLGENVFVGSITQFLSSNYSVYERIITDERLFPLTGLPRMVAEPLNGTVYLINTSYMQQSIGEKLESWRLSTNITYMENSLHANYQSFGKISIGRTGTLEINYVDNSTSLIGGVIRKLPGCITAQELFMVFGASQSNLSFSIEFYRQGNFIVSSSIKPIGESDDSFSLVSLSSVPIVFDEYRIIIKGAETNLPQKLSFDSVLFGVDCID